jgi:hypothetical protein
VQKEAGSNVSDCLAKYKALGKGYTNIMADVLRYVADNPELLSQVTKSSPTTLK